MTRFVWAEKAHVQEIWALVQSTIRAVYPRCYPMEAVEPEAQRAAGGNGTCPETTGSRSDKPHRMSASGIHAKKEGGKRVAGKAEKKA